MGAVTAKLRVGMPRGRPAAMFTFTTALAHATWFTDALRRTDRALTIPNHSQRKQELVVPASGGSAHQGSGKRTHNLLPL